MSTRMTLGAAGRTAAAALIAAALFAAGPARAGAAGAAKPFSLVVDAGYVFVHQPGFGHGWRYGGGLQFRTAKRAAFEVLVESYGVPVAEGAGSVTAGGLAAGRMDMTSLVFNQHVFLLTRGRVLPYATLGVGLAFIGYAPDDPAVVVEKDIVDRFALHVGGGIDLRVSRRLFVTGRLRYNMVKTWVEPLPREGPIRDTDPLAQDMMHLYGLEFGLGLRLAF